MLPADIPRSRNLLFAFLLAFVFLGSIFPITDNDVWWHLETGEYLWQHKAIPRVDMFSYTIAGQPWIAFEWLAQLALFGVFQLAGLGGLTLFKASLVAGIFLLMLKGIKEDDGLLVWLFLGLAFLCMRDGLR
ncbi:MAG: hypothetical protein ACYC5N_10645, partial [Endomicrobiales bacterium]